MPQLLNTNVNLEGKTVLAAENADTITGLKTFNRGAAAPFAVDVASLAVANLNAALCAGLADTETISGDWTLTLGLKERGRTVALGAWQDYTPVWTATGTPVSLGNGTLIGRYTLIGKTVYFSLLLTMGSTTTYGTGQYNFSLPQASAAAADFAFSVRMRPGATDFQIGVGISVSTTAFGIVFDQAVNLIGPTTPRTWTTGDTISVNGIYEMA